MAIYEYRCTACGREFELTRPMSRSSDPADCPSCGKEARRLPSVFGATEGHIIKPAPKEAFRGGITRSSSS